MCQDETHDLPDVFIYLVYDNQNVSYLRKPYKYFKEMMNKEPEFYTLLPDMAISPDMRDD